MELETFEMTVEDILNMHRGWIIQTFVQDRKTEVEIVQILQERQLIVTVSQIHKCLLEWGLLHPHSSSTRASAITSARSHTTEEEWELVPSQASVSIHSDPYLAPVVHDPKVIETYTKRPLPSLPTSNLKKPGSIKLTSAKNYMIPREEPLKAELDLIPEGTSPLEEYVQDPQAHELLAVGLGRRSRMGFLRAGDLRDGGRRVLKSTRRRGGYSEKKPGENSRQ